MNNKEAAEFIRRFHETFATLREYIEKLERENAALRVALEDIMTESDEQHIWRMARAALQKEAHP